MISAISVIKRAILPRTAGTTDSQAQVKPPLFQIRDTRVEEAVTDITGILMLVDVIDATRGHVLLLVLIVGATGSTGIGLGIEIKIEIKKIKKKKIMELWV